jgi:DSF synthase
MGAYSFLQRKVGRRITEELITSGNTYTARQLFDMGVVDVITPDGTGEAAVYSYVRRHARGGNGRRAFEQVRREFEAVTREELDRVTTMWVDAAIKLEERDLKMMDRLVRAQQRNAMDNTGSGAQGARAMPAITRLAAVGGDD